MELRTRPTFLAVALVLLALIVTAVLWQITDDRTHTQHATDLTEDAAPPDEELDLRAGGRDNPLLPSDETQSPKPDDAAMAKYLQDRFGKTIGNKHTQIKAVEKLLAYLMKFYPDDWQDRLYDFLKQAFPDRADELFEKFKQLSKYNDWLVESRDEVVQMSREDRREALWEKRYEIFGPDADEIWAVERKSEQIVDSLDTIAQSKDTSIEEKLDLYVDVVKGAYGDQAERFIERKQTELLSAFLSVDSVQDNLHALPQETRAEKLREVREAMGMDEAALERWDELDRQRDAEWQKGAEYMAERARILATVQGDQQQAQLDQVRERIFGPENATILRIEEESGFLRFDHRQVLGQE